MSKFSAVLAAKRNNQEPLEPAENPQQKDIANSNENQSKLSTQKTIVADRKRGRPNAKRSDPEFVQITAYIRKDTHREVKRELLALQGNDTRDFSELVEDLLAAWLKK